MINYSFATSWIGLNEENYQKYLTLRKRHEDTTTFLERILIGNILSMSKSVGYEVTDKIVIKVRLKESAPVGVKDDITLMAFQGEIETNFLIPDFWGVGKFSSKGYGTVRCNVGGKTS